MWVAGSNLVRVLLSIPFVGFYINAFWGQMLQILKFLIPYDDCNHIYLESFHPCKYYNVSLSTLIKVQMDGFVNQALVYHHESLRGRRTLKSTFRIFPPSSSSPNGFPTFKTWIIKIRGYSIVTVGSPGLSQLNLTQNRILLCNQK